MSRKAVELHYERHHRAYVDKLNSQLEEGSTTALLPLDELVKFSYNHGNPLPYFNNASQAWNHDFFWQSMEPEGGGKPEEGDLLSLIERDFGSFENFVKDFKKAAASQFGSGWTWLVVKPTNIVPDRFYQGPRVLAGRSDERVKVGRLVVENTPNALNPLIWDHVPLLAIDVWEHAYYVDHENERKKYIDTFLENLVSWNAVSERLQRARNFVLMEVPEHEEDEEDGMTDAEWLSVHVNSRAAGRKSEEEEQAEAEKVASEKGRKRRSVVSEQ